MYHNLCVLLEEKDIQKFQILLTKTIQQLQLNDETSLFAEYFIRTYVDRKQQWARCYRQGSFINTNMYDEAFHHVLKYIYMNGRIRVDNCINTLMKITRDKAFKRLIKLTKGKKTKRLIDIHKRHLTSKDMIVDSIEQVEHGVWDVTSSHGNDKYRVTMENEVYPVNYRLRCNDCNICVHSYSCTCQDSQSSTTESSTILSSHTDTLSQSLKSSSSTVGE